MISTFQKAKEENSFKEKMGRNHSKGIKNIKIYL